METVSLMSNRLVSEKKSTGPTQSVSCLSGEFFEGETLVHSSTGVAFDKTNCGFDQMTERNAQSY